MSGKQWWPVGHRYVTGVDEGDKYHATHTGGAMIASRSGQSVDAVCGVIGLRAVVFTTVDRAGGEVGTTVAEWPPFARQGDRCVDCFRQTGRPKVDKASAWRAKGEA